jgi:hypothetical protein
MVVDMALLDRDGNVGVTFLKVVQYVAGRQLSRTVGNVAYFPAAEAARLVENGTACYVDDPERHRKVKAAEAIYG